MKAKILSIAIASLAGAALADTITWTGEASTYVWGTAGNWSPSRVPGATDDVVVDTAAVEKSGDLIVSSLTLTGGATVAATGELKSTAEAPTPVYTGGKVTCSLIALLSGPITLSDAEIVSGSTAHKNGIYGGGNAAKYLNFVDGASRAAKYTYATSWNPSSDNTYVNFFQGNNAYIRYNGNAIDEATFSANFLNTDNGDGTSTISMKSIDGWNLGALTAGDVLDGQVTVSVTATKYSGGDATVYFVQGTRDYGETFADWPTATDGEVLASTGTASETLTLEEGYNYIRAFLLCAGEYKVTAAVTKHVMAPYGDYGELTDVYEYIGENNNLGIASNWAKDKVAPADAAPTAGTDIRWFGKNANYSGELSITDKDYIDGATLALSGDCNVSSDVVFSNSVVSIYTIVPSEPVVFSLYGSSLTTTRNDQWLGVYPPGTYQSAEDKTFINFLPGKVSSFTFTDNNISISGADSAKTVLVTPGYLKLGGAAIADADWETFFSVDVSGKTVSITYDPSVDENKISSVAASEVTTTSATLAATIFSIADGASVIVACDTAAITEENVIAKGEVVAVSEGVATKSVTTLVSGNVYNFAFAIVQNNIVKAFKSGVFFTSDFDYVYMDGAWQGSIPSTLNTAESVLIMSPYDNEHNNISVANTVVSNASLRTGTLVNSGPMQVYSSSIVNGKLGDTDAVCGTYNGVTFMNFVSLSGNGVVYQACSYTFNATEEWKNNAYDLLFDTQERIHLNGAKVDSGVYASNFTLTDNGATGNEATPYNLTLTYWEPVWTGVPKADWTVQPGARVKLTKDTRIGALTVADSTDVKIDLNGYNLKVVALFVNGEEKKGEFAAGDLPMLTGEGSLTVSGPGFAIIIR